MQCHTFKADFLILPLDNFVMVLEIQWLSELGDIMWNFKQLQMRFQVDNQQCLLQGELDSKLQVVNKENMQKLLTKESQLSLSQCYTVFIQPCPTKTLINSVEEELQKVLYTLPNTIAEVLV